MTHVDEMSGPSHPARGRSLLAAAHSGSFSTLDHETGHPYGSLIRVAAYRHGNPLILLSTLAAHTRNLADDARCSLLVSTPDLKANIDLLDRPRVTILGHARRIANDDVDSAREVYLKLHPSAERYVDFTDFDFWNIEVDRVRFVGGFGQMSWINPADWQEAEPDPLAPHLVGIVSHMNADHQDALNAYVRAFTTIESPLHVAMTGIDSVGFDLRVEDKDGRLEYPRLSFESVVDTPTKARKALVALVQAARSQLGEPSAD